MAEVLRILSPSTTPRETTTDQYRIVSVGRRFANQLGELDTYSCVGNMMGERYVQSTIEVANPIDFRVGDYVTYNGEDFKLYGIPTAEKTEQNTYKYTLKFESCQKELATKAFLDLISGDQTQYYTATPTVNFTGNITELVSRINANLANAGLTYLVDVRYPFDDTVVKDISLQDQTIWDACMLFQSEFGYNFYVKPGVIQVNPEVTAVANFEYGQGKGLYEITRNIDDSAPVITRLRAYGGSRNLPYQYNVRPSFGAEYHPNLMMPNFSSTGIDYIESANQDIYGIRDGVLRNDEIYPTIKGMTADQVTAAGYTLQALTEGNLDEIVAVSPVTSDTQAQFSVWIKDLGFDIMEQDETGKYVYLQSNSFTLAFTNSYALGGLEFEVTSCVEDATYPAARWKLTMSRSDQDAFKLPDAVTNAVAGDKFVLLNIFMPSVYVDAAEERLLVAAQEYLAKSDVSKATYTVSVDEIFMANSGTLWQSVVEGNHVDIYDRTITASHIVLPIQSITVDWGASAIPSFKLTLSDEPVATTIGGIKSDITEVKGSVSVAQYKNNASARKNVKMLERLRDYLINPDGYFNNESIKPLSIETMYLSVGATAYNFVLSGVDIIPNTEGNPNSVVISSGTLTHNAISRVGGGNSWVADTYVNSSLTSGSVYYVYVVCSKTSNSASYQLSTTQKNPDPGTGFYWFPIGILYDAVDGVRGYVFNYGKTYINGRFITTGRIQDNSANNFFDLDNGTFKIGDNVTSLDWGVTEAGKLTIKGGMVQSPSGESYPIGIDRGTWNSGVLYYIGEKVTYAGSLYRSLTDENVGNTPTSSPTYWEIYVQKGADGATINVKGHKATVGDLPSTGNSQYDAYVVDSSGHLYVCTALPNTWTDVGQFKGDKGDAGANAPNIRVSGKNVFKFEANSTTPTETSVTLAAFLTNLTGYQWRYWNGVSWTNISGANNPTYVLSWDNVIWGSNSSIRVSCLSGSMYDELTVSKLYDGGDAYTFVVSDPTITLPCYSNGNPKDTNLQVYNTEVSVYRGATVLKYGTDWALDEQIETDATFGYADIGDNLLVSLVGISASTGSTRFAITGIADPNIPYTYLTFRVTKSLDGVAGAKGDIGVTGNYVAYQWQAGDSATTAPTGAWSDNPVSIGIGQYLWQRFGVFTYNGTQVESWSAGQRIGGLDGAVPTSMGEYSGSVEYYGNYQRKDVVLVAGVPYIARNITGLVPSGKFSNKYPPSYPAYWETFGENFKSVATDTLLANLANIAGFIFYRNNAGSIQYMASQAGFWLDAGVWKATSDTSKSGYVPAIKIDPIGKKIEVRSLSIQYDQAGVESGTTLQVSAIDSDSGAIYSENTEGDAAYVTSNGISANKAATVASPSSGGMVMASMVGVGNCTLDKSISGARREVAGLYGVANNTGNADSFGVVAEKLKTYGMYANVTTHTGSGDYTCTEEDYYVHCYNSAPISVYLTPNPTRGQVLNITAMNSSDITLRSSGTNKIFRDGSELTAIPITARGKSSVLVWDGTYWVFNHLNE